jgi:hypothetical protein
MLAHTGLDYVPVGIAGNHDQPLIEKHMKRINVIL